MRQRVILPTAKAAARPQVQAMLDSYSHSHSRFLFFSYHLSVRGDPRPEYQGEGSETEPPNKLLVVMRI